MIAAAANFTNAEALRYEFSKPLRSRFDEALPDLSDASGDLLLHIPGTLN
jgi:hypothetical protein